MAVEGLHKREESRVFARICLLRSLIIGTESEERQHSRSAKELGMRLGDWTGGVEWGLKISAVIVWLPWSDWHVSSQVCLLDLGSEIKQGVGEGKLGG